MTDSTLCCLVHRVEQIAMCAHNLFCRLRTSTGRSFHNVDDIRSTVSHMSDRNTSCRTGK